MKNTLFKYLSSVLFLFITIVFTANAQTEVTFKLNLQPQLEDSTFIPGRDRVYLKGNIFPLSNTKNTYLKDVAPIDSVYETTVNFSARNDGKALKYNFFIYTPDKLKKEHRTRSLKLQGKKMELSPIHFDSFAW
ncbi:hypothetical protein [Fodinibius halophilus]|uniref:Uncharacterized protein n=1 Tax=Fodinibius halophilus TaxID=1736908 RepID=A0A6M1T571_9BACT|nr:hypothetical protein [Fodinibius halophilus]NGP87823.1 hypothetical protein [Fodinibius halophilus]